MVDNEMRRTVLDALEKMDNSCMNFVRMPRLSFRSAMKKKTKHQHASQTTTI